MILEPPPASPAKKYGLNGYTNGHNGVHNGEANGNGILNGSGNGVYNGNGHTDVGQSRVFILSAKDSVACQTMMDSFAIYVGNTKPSVSDLAYTLANRRSMHPWVAAVRARTIDELAERLRDPLIKPSSTAKRPRLAFVFNGQGAQWHAMRRELIDAYPVFGRSIQEADKILKEWGAFWSLKGMYNFVLRAALL